MTPARTLAKAWRANPADRLRIERQIAVEGRQHEFTRNRDGELVARMTPGIRRAITASGGGAYRSAADRRFGSFSPEQVEAAAIGFEREPHTGLIHCGEDRVIRKDAA